MHLFLPLGDRISMDFKSIKKILLFIDRTNVLPEVILINTVCLLNTRAALTGRTPEIPGNLAKDQLPRDHFRFLSQA